MTDDSDDSSAPDRRVVPVRVSVRTGGGAAPGAADGDAVTERHPVRYPTPVRSGSDAYGSPGSAPRMPASEDADAAEEVPDEPEEPDSPADWLLEPDAESGRPVVTPDAVTEALPHGRIALRRAKRRRAVWMVAVGVLVLGLVGGLVVARNVFGLFFPPDYDGPGTGQVVVHVDDGVSTRQIGEELQRQDVVESARAFGKAAEADPRGRGIQPGYYVVRHRMSSATAVTALLDPVSRLGQAEIRGGTQLDDTAGPNSTTVPGVLSLVSRATCVPADADRPAGLAAGENATAPTSGTTGPGTVGPGTVGTAATPERCVGVDELRRVMATTDPADLDIPAWALADVRRVDPQRRLEGLVAPGRYDIAPGSGARDALAAVMRASTPRLEASGLVGAAGARGVSPYQALVVASLAEKEGVAEDFGKISRVVYNRLDLPMRLQLDSTINYPLDKQRLLTQPVDRARPGPYNTYLDLGLPPTPIGSASTDAVRAALQPPPGPWVYFVKCQPTGESCFAVTQPEHDANRRLAQQRGTY